MSILGLVWGLRSLLNKYVGGKAGYTSHKRKGGKQGTELKIYALHYYMNQSALKTQISFDN